MSNEKLIFFEVKIGYKTYRLKAQQVYLDSVKEQYKITTLTQEILLQSNRPFFRNKGLKHRRPDWQVLQSSIKLHQSTITKITEELTKIIDI